MKRIYRRLFLAVSVGTGAAIVSTTAAFAVNSL